MSHKVAEGTDMDTKTDMDTNLVTIHWQGKLCSPFTVKRFRTDITATSIMAFCLGVAACAFLVILSYYTHEFVPGVSYTFLFASYLITASMIGNYIIGYYHVPLRVDLVIGVQALASLIAQIANMLSYQNPTIFILSYFYLALAICDALIYWLLCIEVRCEETQFFRKDREETKQSEV